MRDMRDKLRRAHRDRLPQDRAAPEAGFATARDLLLRRHARLARERPRVPLPDGEEVRNERGCFWLVRERYAIDHRHGRVRFDELDGLDWHGIAAQAKAGAAGELARDDCLFLDTETTGLAGGAGTMVFLCGLGFFEDDAFVLEQVFLRQFNEEAAALAHVALRLSEHPALVTFVGKSFDRHRLAARMAVTRVQAPILTERHVDLYYLARRRYKDRLPDCRLRTVEEQVLGVFRDDDLPGSEAPGAFFEWIRSRTGRIDRVFEHNRIDVLSLVSLLAVIGAPDA